MESKENEHPSLTEPDKPSDTKPRVERLFLTSEDHSKPNPTMEDHSEGLSRNPHYLDTQKEAKGRVERINLGQPENTTENDTVGTTTCYIEAKDKPIVVKVSSNFRVTLPKELAEKLGIREGDYVRVYQSGNKVVLEKIVFS
jgi:AbrB family looped-hinge helix DNA binding protein